jgi:predicted  nucleic acid-binding Zn-ribbon protein
MDHPCYKCGHSIADGKAFCPQCGAPQIRVAVAEAPVPPLAGNVSENDRPALALDPPGIQGSVGLPVLSAGIEWSRAIRVCAVAALISALVLALRLTVPLLAGFGAGFLAVALYHQRNPAWRVTARSGAQLGAACGFLFFVMAAIFVSLAVAVLHKGGQVRQTVMEAIQQAAAHSSDPQVQATLDRLKTPEGLAATLILMLIFLLVVSIAASTIAGALTGAFLGRRNRP